MKNDSIALIYRKQKEGRYSMERLFKPLEALTTVKRIELPCELNSISNFVRLIFFAITIKETKVHITGDVHYMAFILFWKKVILTIHDLNHYEELSGIKKKIYGFIWFWLPLKMANVITVISPYTQKQLNQYFKCKNEKIYIVDNTFNKIIKKPMNKNNSIYNILVIGTGKNKNLERLVHSIQDICNCHLTIIGILTEYTKELIIRNNISFSNYWDLDEEELADQYNSADVLFFASTKEGFGLPILEAQSIGLPVITSNTTAMPYVAGQGAFLVNPYCQTEIANSLKRIKKDEKFRANIISQGYRNIERFSDSKFVKDYCLIYKLLSNKNKTLV